MPGKIKTGLYLINLGQAKYKLTEAMKNYIMDNYWRIKEKYGPQQIWVGCQLELMEQFPGTPAIQSTTIRNQIVSRAVSTKCF